MRTYSFNNRFIAFKLGRVLFIIVMLLTILINKLYAQTSEKFIVGTIEAEPGIKASGNLIIKAGSDQESFVPVTIINGSKQGPVLTLVAGNHGTEYVPIITLQNLAAKIDPQSLTGTLILVHIANVVSFSKRAVYLSPVDNKNINRVYPGKSDGTLSERIAYIITNNIIDKSDYLIDLHGGEFNENIINFAIYTYDCPNEDAICEQSKIMANAFGVNYLLPSPYNVVPDSIEYTFCDLAALRRGVAAITVEIGDRGRIDPEIVNFAERGILNIMREFGMMKGEAFKNEHPVYLIDDTIIRSKSDGIFYSLVDCHQSISKGTLLGYTTDFFGNRIEDFYSPISGIVVKANNSPAINKGENIFWIAKTVDKF